jgi:hypothetical protein
MQSDGYCSCLVCLPVGLSTCVSVSVTATLFIGRYETRHFCDFSKNAMNSIHNIYELTGLCSSYDKLPLAGTWPVLGCAVCPGGRCEGFSPLHMHGDGDMLRAPLPHT